MAASSGLNRHLKQRSTPSNCRRMAPDAWIHPLWILMVITSLLVTAHAQSTSPPTPTSSPTPVPAATTTTTTTPDIEIGTIPTLPPGGINFRPLCFNPDTWLRFSLSPLPEAVREDALDLVVVAVQPRTRQGLIFQMGDTNKGHRVSARVTESGRVLIDIDNGRIRQLLTVPEDPNVDLTGQDFFALTLNRTGNTLNVSLETYQNTSDTAWNLTADDNLATLTQQWDGIQRFEDGLQLNEGSLTISASYVYLGSNETYSKGLDGCVGYLSIGENREFLMHQAYFDPSYVKTTFPEGYEAMIPLPTIPAPPTTIQTPLPTQVTTTVAPGNLVKHEIQLGLVGFPWSDQYSNSSSTAHRMMTLIAVGLVDQAFQNVPQYSRAEVTGFRPSEDNNETMADVQIYLTTEISEAQFSAALAALERHERVSQVISQAAPEPMPSTTQTFSILLTVREGVWDEQYRNVSSPIYIELENTLLTWLAETFENVTSYNSSTISSISEGTDSGVVIQLVIRFDDPTLTRPQALQIIIAATPSFPGGQVSFNETDVTTPDTTVMPNGTSTTMDYTTTMMNGTMAPGKRLKITLRVTEGLNFTDDYRNTSSEAYIKLVETLRGWLAKALNGTSYLGAEVTDIRLGSVIIEFVASFSDPNIDPRTVESILQVAADLFPQGSVDPQSVQIQDVTTPDTTVMPNGTSTTMDYTTTMMNGTMAPGKRLKITLRVTEGLNFTDDYRNTSSEAYIKLVETLRGWLAKALNGTSYLGAEVTDIRPGSVIIEFVASFSDPNIDSRTVGKTLQVAADLFPQGSVDPESVQVQDVTTPDTTVMPNGTSTTMDYTTTMMNGTMAPGKRLKITLRVTEGLNFTDDYRNTSSEAYIKLVETLRGWLAKALNGTSYLGAEVTDIRLGSVIIEFVASFSDPNIDPRTVESILQVAADLFPQGSVDPQSVQIQDVTTPDTTVMPNGTSTTMDYTTTMMNGTMAPGKRLKITLRVTEGLNFTDDYRNTSSEAYIKLVETLRGWLAKALNGTSYLGAEVTDIRLGSVIIEFVASFSDPNIDPRTVESILQVAADLFPQGSVDPQSVQIQDVTTPDTTVMPNGTSTTMDYTTTMMNGTMAPGKRLKITLRVTEGLNFTDDYRNTSSEAYIKLVETLRGWLAKALNGTSYLGAEVTDIRPGSVIIEFVASFSDPNIDSRTVGKTLQVAADLFPQGSVDPESVQVQDLDPTTTSTMSTSTMETATTITPAITTGENFTTPLTTIPTMSPSENETMTENTTTTSVTTIPTTAVELENTTAMVNATTMLPENTTETENTTMSMTTTTALPLDNVTDSNMGVENTTAMVNATTMLPDNTTEMGNTTMYEMSTTMLPENATDMGNTTTMLPYNTTEMVNGSTMLTENATDMGKTTTMLPYNTTEMVNGTTMLPENTTDMVNTTTMLPYNTTEMVNGTTMLPENTTDMVNATGTTMLPENTTDMVNATTMLPYNTTEMVNGTTMLPDNTTEMVNGTTMLPDSTTDMVNATTMPPYNTTEMVNATTMLPDNTTETENATTPMTTITALPPNNITDTSNMTETTPATTETNTTLDYSTTEEMNRTMVPGKRFLVSLRLTDPEWKDEFQNTSSPAYIDLVNKVQDWLMQALKDKIPSYEGSEVTQISQGSVIIEFVSSFNDPEVDSEQVKEALTAAAGNFTAGAIDTEQLLVADAVTTTATPTTMVTTTPIVVTADNFTTMSTTTTLDNVTEAENATTSAPTMTTVENVTALENATLSTTMLPTSAEVENTTAMMNATTMMPENATEIDNTTMYETTTTILPDNTTDMVNGTTMPSYNTTEMVNGTTMLPDNTTEMVNGTTMLPANTTEMVNGTTMPPYNTTEMVNGTTMLPDNTTDMVNGTTMLPDNTTDMVNATTMSPYNTTEMVNGTTMLPDNTTDMVNGTTMSPYNTTEMVNGTTMLLNNTTEMVNTTTMPPYNTTEMVNATTMLPDNTTEMINGTTMLPDNTTDMVNATTMPPYNTTEMVNATTMLPDNTTEIENTTMSMTTTTALPLDNVTDTTNMTETTPATNETTTTTTPMHNTTSEVSSTAAPGVRFKVSLRVIEGLNYTEEYKNTSSQAYKDLTERLMEWLRNAMSGIPSYQRAEVTKISQGSVIIEFETFFNEPNIGPDLVEEALKAAANSFPDGGVIDSEEITVADSASTPSQRTVSATTESVTTATPIAAENTTEETTMMTTPLVVVPDNVTGTDNTTEVTTATPTTITVLPPDTNTTDSSMANMTASTTEMPDNVTDSINVTDTTTPPSVNISDTTTTYTTPENATDIENTTLPITTEPTFTTNQNISDVENTTISTTMLPENTTEMVNATTMLPDNTTEMVNATTMSPDNTTEMVNATTMPPYNTTEMVNATTMPPYNTTEMVNATTMLPDNTTEMVNATAMLPDNTTDMVNATTMPPYNTTEMVNATTMLPDITTEMVNATTMPPDNTTEMVNATTMPPYNTTEMVNATTMLPDNTTEIENTTMSMTTTPPDNVTDTTMMEMNSTAAPSLRMHVRLRVNLTWNDDYNDMSSQAYMDLVNGLMTWLKEALIGFPHQGSDVMDISPGSVVIDLELKFSDPKVDQQAVLEALRGAVDTFPVGQLAPESVSVPDQVTTDSPGTTTTPTTTPIVTDFNTTMEEVTTTTTISTTTSITGINTTVEDTATTATTENTTDVSTAISTTTPTDDNNTTVDTTPTTDNTTASTDMNTTTTPAVVTPTADVDNTTEMSNTTTTTTNMTSEPETTTESSTTMMNTTTTAPPTEIIRGKFVITQDLTWNDELADTNNPATKGLADDIQKKLLAVFSGLPGLVDIRNVRFSQGSVEVLYDVVVVKGQITPTNLTQTLRHHVGNNNDKLGGVYTLSYDGIEHSKVRVEDDDDDDIPAWGIAVIVCGSLLLIFLVFMVVVLCSRRSSNQKYKMAEDPEDLQYKRSWASGSNGHGTSPSQSDFDYDNAVLEQYRPPEEGPERVQMKESSDTRGGAKNGDGAYGDPQKGFLNPAFQDPDMHDYNRMNGTGHTFGQHANGRPNRSIVYKDENTLTLYNIDTDSWETHL